MCQRQLFLVVMPILCMLCRLYSSAHYNDTFPRHTPPEILNTPLEGVVLLLKAMSVDKVRPVVFKVYSPERKIASEPQGSSLVMFLAGLDHDQSSA